MSKQVVVEAYNSKWPEQFLELKALLWPAVQDFALSIEHVGSTSIPGLAAKPILDIDIIIPDSSFLNQTIVQLKTLGYEHQGNWGIVDREVFKTDLRPLHVHNLYVCPKESISLRNHLCLRDSLRANPQLRDQYAAVKYELAQKFPNSIDDYIEGKTDFILKILQQQGYGPDSLEMIRKANLAPAPKT